MPDAKPAVRIPPAPGRVPPPSLVQAFFLGLFRAPRVSRGRFFAALCVALAADLLFWWIGEGVPVFADFVVGALLALCLGGLNLELIFAFFAEAVPGIGVIPWWTAAVPILWARSALGRKAHQYAQAEAATASASATTAASRTVIDAEPLPPRPGLPEDSARRDGSGGA